MVAVPILYQDEHLVAVEKPEGVHVHPPEDRRARIKKSQNGLAIVRDQIGQYLYPVHRLDPATSGVLIYALSSDAAAKIQEQFRAGTVGKRYWAISRGFFAGDLGAVDRPLKRDGVGTIAPALTHWQVLARAQAEWPVGDFPCSRYTWVEARPKTGVYHQIRRHFSGIARPILGDRVHGDGIHNRKLTEKTGVTGLCLRAVEIDFNHPFSGERLKIKAPPSEKWERLKASLPWTWV